jgi:hypothetical protein
MMLHHLRCHVLMCRLPTGPNNLTNEANTTICSQRMLDATFINISSPNNALNLTSWVYFGSVEGVQRNFPGRVCSHTIFSEIISL